MCSMRKLLTSMAVLGILVSTADVAIGQGRTGAAPPIEGVWKGVSAVRTGANASTNPSRLPMLLIYTRGHFAVVAQDNEVAQPRRQAPAPPPLKTPGKPTDAEKIALYDFWAPVIANAGSYEVKGNMVIQRQMVGKGALAVNTWEFRLEDGGKTYIEIGKAAPGQPASEIRRTYTRLE